MRKTAESPKASNRGEYINDWNAEFKMKAVPWCATSMSVWSQSVITPRIHSARAKDFGSQHRHTLSDVMRGLYIPKVGDYRVKTRQGGNHVDLIIAWKPERKEGLILGGNVSDKVTLRKITLKSMVADGTTGITEVHGNYDYTITDSATKKYLNSYTNIDWK